MPNVFRSNIKTNTQIAENVYSLTFSCKAIAEDAHPGQFLHIKCASNQLLRRPISICSTDGNEIRIVFEVKGSGTKWLSLRKPGETLDVLGPLGKGFDIPRGKIIVAGGGIGTPPMLFAAQESGKSASNEVTAVIGFQNINKVILQSEFEQICKKVIVTTDDGSAGMRGFLTQPLEDLLASSTPGTYNAVLSCGPHIMQKSIAALCAGYNIPCQVSLEERMGCGIGACLVCVCATQKDGQRQMSRVCYDGPVFNCAEVIW